MSREPDEADKPHLKRTFSNKLFGKKNKDTGEDAPNKEEKPELKRTFSSKFGKKDEKTGEDAQEKPELKRTFSSKFGKKNKESGDDVSDKEEKPALKRTFSSKFGKKDADGQDAAKEEKPELKRTFSSKFGKKNKETGDDLSDKEEKPALKRTFSNKLFGKKDEKTGEDAQQEKPELKRTLSISKLGRKSQDGSDISDSEKPVLKRTFSQKFQKEEKKKLKARFDIRVVRISKCQINNTTVFLGWSRPATSVGGDTKRAVVTDCWASFGDTISVEAVLSLPSGSEKFKPALINFELKEDKLVRKGAAKAKWHVLGRGEFDLADYVKAQKMLCIIPLTKKKANIQLELEVTAIWQHYDGQRFEQLIPTTSSVAASAEKSVKKVESIGTAKYAVASDSEVDVYTEEDVDLNLSEIVSDEDDEEYKSAYSAASNPFEKQDAEDAAGATSSSFASMLSSLAGNQEPERPKREPPKKEQVEQVKNAEAKQAEEVRSAEQKRVEDVKMAEEVEKGEVVSSNPFEKKPEKSLTTCHDCKRENKVGWKFCDTCGARSKVEEVKKVEEPKKVDAPKKAEEPKKVDAPKKVEEPKKVDAPKKVEEPKKVDAPKKVEEPKKVDAPKKVEEPKKVDAPRKSDEPTKQDVLKKVDDLKKQVADEAKAESFSSDVRSNTVEELRALVDQQRREILNLKESERKFSNAVTLAERKALAAETMLQGKERELKRLVVQRSAAAGGSSDDVSELLKQISELEVDLRVERRRGEFQTMMENVVFLCSFSFTKENESVAALKMFDEFIRLSLFDENFGRQNMLLMDHLLNTIVLICQNPKIPPEVTQYWIVSAVHLLKLIKDGMKRLKSAVSGDHPLLHMERGLGELATTLYTRLFTVTLRKIESLLIASLGAPFQTAAYFRPDELVMGEILREFSGLMSGFKSNRWTSAMIELFFKFCVDLVNRFLANKIIQERKYCTLLNGIKIKMEVSFLIEWMLKNPETQVLIGALDQVLEAANVLIMSKQRNNSLTEFRALNVRQIHAILSQYQPQPDVVAPAAAKQPAFPVVPSGLSKSSREIVERLEKDKGSLSVAEKTDEVDPLLLKRLEADDSFARCELLIVDQLAEDIATLQKFLQE